MGSSSKKLVKISIQRPSGRLTAMLGKDGKVCMPAIDTSKGTKAQALPEKAGSKIKLIHEPISKKAVKRLPWQEACLALCKFPECLEDAASAAKLLLLVLLSQVGQLLLGIAPMLPAICLDVPSGAVLNILGILLRAIQGPEEWSGDDWKLLRPWVVHPRLSLCETTPSATLSDYIGGKFHTFLGKKRTFCYPYINSAVVLAPGLPIAIEKALIGFSPLSLPVVFGRKGIVKGRLILEWKASSFASYDTVGVEKLRTLGHSCYLEITLFLQWLCEKKKRIERWKEDFKRYRPFTRKGRFTTPASGEETELLCAALALFRQFLVYASEKNDWLTQEEAQEIMLQYWRWVLPESAPKEDNRQGEPVVLNYESPDIFYQFLTEWFLPTYCGQILYATKGTQGTMGLIRSLEGSDLFITPRQIFLEAYSQWLRDHGGSTLDLSIVHGEAAAQRKLLEAGVPLRHEGNNPSTWRYAFYGKAAGNVNCLALPVEKLPEAVQNAFGALFGDTASAVPDPSGAEAVPNREKGGDAL